MFCVDALKVAECHGYLCFLPLHGAYLEVYSYWATHALLHHGRLYFSCEPVKEWLPRGMKGKKSYGEEKYACRPLAVSPWSPQASAGIASIPSRT